VLPINIQTLCDDSLVDVRYQVFVSSTYVDLVDERKAIIQAVLELDCIPAGMEMFVATDEDQWDLIKEVIDFSDYYLVIVGARYGHVTDQKISYTEKEYNYALESGKPIIAFVHGNPDSVPSGKTDKDTEKAEKLDAFRNRVRDGSDGVRRNVGEFLTADELAAKVSRALSRAIKRYPGTGWVRGDHAMTVETQQEIIDLKSQVTNLKTEKFAAQTALVEDVEELAQGSEKITLKINVNDTSYPVGERKKRITVKPVTTWDDIFRELGPLLIGEAAEKEVVQRLEVHLYSSTCLNSEDLDRIRDMGSDTSRSLIRGGGDSVLLQLRALGLIENGRKSRQIADKTKYLALTQKGERYLLKLRAIKRGVDPGAPKTKRVETHPEF
jgi:hypothetical protein